MSLIVGVLLLKNVLADFNVAYAETGKFEIIEGMYDSYTDSDYLTNSTTKQITSYPTDATLYQSTSTILRSNGTFNLTVAGDDPIVQIVPKELFKNIGDHLYIGREYGFYVKTEAEKYHYKDADNSWQYETSRFNRKSTVMVFDIHTLNDMVETIDRFIVSVSPLYQYEYAYIAPQASFLTLATTGNEDRFNIQVNYYVSTARIVATGLVTAFNQIKYEQVEKYYAKDVSFASQLLNEQAPNDFYSEIYNASNDIGSFFTGYDYSYDGIAIKDGSVVDDVILGLNKASYLLGCASTAISFFPGVNAIVSPILGVAGLLTGIPGFVINSKDIYNELNSNDQISLKSGTITAVPLYTTKAHQIANYGRLIKKAAIAINTGIDQSIWYTRGSKATAYFTMSNSAGSLQSEYQTRIVREIGLHIIDENDNIQASSVSSYDYINGDNVIEQLILEGNDNVYLMPKGNNYFSFFSEYTSDYQLSFDVDANLTVYVNGNIINTSDNTYSFKLNSNSNNNIRIYNNDGIIIGPISIETSTNPNNININAGGNYLIKQDINIVSYMQVVLSNENLQIANIFSIKNGQLFSYSFENQSIYETDCLSIPLTEGIKYFLIYNTTTTALSTNLSFQNVNSLSVGSNSDNIEKNWKYYKFSVPVSGSYAFSYAFTNASISLGIWDASFEKLDVLSSTNAIVIYDLMQNQNIWIGFRNNTLTEVNGTITANTTQNSFKWKLNGSYISGQSKSLERGTTYNLQFWINNDCQILNFEKVNGSSYFSTSANGDMAISETCPIGTNIIHIRAFADDTCKVSYTFYLNITTTYETKIKIIDVLNDETELGFNWSIYTSGITAFKYVIRASQSTAERIVSVSSSSGSVNFLSIVNLANPTTSITITKITINGIERVYDSPTAKFTNLSTRFKGGSGTVSDPYLIENIRHFNNICLVSNKDNANRNNEHFKQIKGLYFEGTSTSREVDFYGKYTTIGYGFHKVVISDSENVVGGLFSRNYGTISGLASVTVNITSTNSSAKVGGVVGINYGTLNCPLFLIVDIKANNYYNGATGGVAGKNESGATLNGGMVGGTILSKGDTGGLAGINGGTINGGLVSVNITYYQRGETNRSIGGLVGFNNTGSIMTGSANYSGTVTYGGNTEDDLFKGNYSLSRTLAPRMAILIGHNKGTLNSTCISNGAKVDTGDLQTVRWKGGFLNLIIYTWNQAQFASNVSVGYTG